ncbi:hypothetical protein NDU88_001039 [Pleurodeles waltl]|uniref:Uncharacterized protein n=1 Tax=Pleurodeles waltl TaxID=8319 RepID=A0AAV7MRP0_PLEWA|nr:hypothetical protein NDU88_001039 [Pleurodeles waltl]
MARTDAKARFETSNDRTRKVPAGTAVTWITLAHGTGTNPNSAAPGRIVPACHSVPIYAFIIRSLPHYRSAQLLRSEVPPLAATWPA